MCFLRMWLSTGVVFLVMLAAVLGNPCCLGPNRYLKNKGNCEGMPDNSAQPLNCSFFALNPTKDPKEGFSVDPLTNMLKLDEDPDYAVAPELYCVTRLVSDTGVDTVAFVCFPDDIDTTPDDTNFVLYSACLLVSVVFLAATLVVYILVPELRDLQGKALMCLMFSLMVGYTSLALLQLRSGSYTHAACVGQAFFTYFWMLSAFFWLNTVSFEVWRTVRFRQFVLSDGKLFLAYGIFAVGGPLVFLITALIVHHVPGGDIIRPNFGVTKCWFDSPAGTWTYFNGPMAVLLCCNVIYFVWTGWMLWKDCQNQSAPRLRCLRYKCILYLKLFLVMGIPWIFEILSMVIAQEHGFWIITDLFNSLQGLIFFLVLVVFRKRALRGLRKHQPCILICPSKWAAGVDEESEAMLAEEEELSQARQSGGL